MGTGALWSSLFIVVPCTVIVQTLLCSPCSVHKYRTRSILSGKGQFVQRMGCSIQEYYRMGNSCLEYILTPVCQPITYLHPVSCVHCGGGGGGGNINDTK